MKLSSTTRIAAFSVALLASVPFAFGAIDASKPAAPNAQAAAAEPADSTVVSKVTVEGKTLNVTYGQVKDKLKLLPPQLQGSLMEIFPLLQKSEETAQIISYLAEKAGTKNDPEYQKMVVECQKGVLQKLFLDKYTKDMITEGDLKTAYDKLKDMYKDEKVYNIGIITVTDKNKAKKIFDSVNATNFSEIEAKESMIKTPAELKESYLRLSDLPESIREKIKKLQDAKGKEPVKVTKVPSVVEMPMPDQNDPNKKITAYSIIMVQDSKDIEVPSFEKSKDELRSVIFSDMQKKAIAKLQEQAKIERFTMDGKPVDDKANAVKETSAKTDATKADAPNVDAAKADAKPSAS